MTNDPTDKKKRKPVEVTRELIQKLSQNAAENPGTLPYAHSTSGAVVQPTEEALLKKYALENMQHQASDQMNIVADFARLALKHAEQIRKKSEIAEKIYGAKLNFKPKIGSVYYLYFAEKASKYILSIVAPHEWGERKQELGYSYIAQVRYMYDLSWDVMQTADDSDYLK